MGREKLEHLVTTGMFKGIRSREKQCEKTDGLTKWLKLGQAIEALKAMRDRDVWKVMISHTKEQRT